MGIGFYGLQINPAFWSLPNFAAKLAPGLVPVTFDGLAQAVLPGTARQGT
jgi:hypothetical protein